MFQPQYVFFLIRQHSISAFMFWQALYTDSETVLDCSGFERVWEFGEVCFVDLLRGRGLVWWKVAQSLKIFGELIFSDSVFEKIFTFEQRSKIILLRNGVTILSKMYRIWILSRFTRWEISPNIAVFSIQV